MASPFYALMLRNRHTRTIRSGQRRAKEILANPKPVALTDNQRAILQGRDTTTIINALIGTSALDGTQVATTQLMRLTQLPEDRLVDAARALELQGIVRINSIMGRSNPQAWFFEIPADGLHILAAARGPRALDAPEGDETRALE